MRFPKHQRHGRYLRLEWNIPTSVAILPLLSDGRIVLLRTFRHALREWTLEIPRGLGKLHETPKATAIRERAEESGLKVVELIDLGIITPDSGILSSNISLFLAKVVPLYGVSNASGDSREAIGNVLVISTDEIIEMIKKCQIIDSYTITAVFRAILQKYIIFD